MNAARIQHIIDNMSFDEVRAFNLRHAGGMFALLLGEPGGREQVEEHRARALRMSSEATDWGSIAYAQSILYAADVALDESPKGACGRWSNVVRLHLRRQLERTQISSDLACMVLHGDAWRVGDHSIPQANANEAWHAACRTFRIAGEQLRQMGAESMPERSYMRIPQREDIE